MNKKSQFNSPVRSPRPRPKRFHAYSARCSPQTHEKFKQYQKFYSNCGSPNMGRKSPRMCDRRCAGDAEASQQFLDILQTPRRYKSAESIRKG